MKRVLVTLVSIGLIAGMAALIPLFAGNPASAATPCTTQHKAVARAQHAVKHDKAKLAKDRKHHKVKAVKKDKRKLKAAQRKLRTARKHLRVCQVNHKPTKAPSSPSSGLPTGLPSGFPTSLPTDPSALCTTFGQPADCLPSGIPTDPTAICSALGLQSSDCPPTSLPTGLPTGLPGASLPTWVTNLFGATPNAQVLSLLETAFGNPLPATGPSTGAICTALIAVPTLQPAGCALGL